ncbi:TetR family transcriptional regulator [Sphaerisporangium sp. NPDC005288]|uniref:TetR family transcriptional regulator n=1 Tax=Sphaerisporangium rhizosphaerae TaxID=2269375 RepID=A0ABW2PA13_9ACTN
MEETRRERKKRMTRQLIAETALRLFAEQGYEQTTVAQITSAADVATKTFFNYFPSKEDVLFAHTERHSRVLLDTLAARREGESIPDLLARVYEETIARYVAEDPPMERERELSQAYAHMIMTVPALQAKALHLMLDLQRRIAEELLKAFPGELDPVSAGAVVGAMMGAVQGAGLAGAAIGRSQAEVLDALRRGIEVAMAGVRSFG